MNFVRGLSTLGLCLIFVFLPLAVVLAGSTETVTDLQEAATEGLADARDAQDALADITQLVDKLKADPTFASNVFTAVSKNDQTTLLNLVKPSATRTSVSVPPTATPYTFTIDFQSNKGRIYIFCVSTRSQCPGGKGFKVGCTNCPAR